MSGNALKVDQSVINEFADAYRSALTAATRAGVDADPEAQLTTPVSNLLTGLAGAAALGRLELVREVQLVGSRPDFGAICSGLFRGWIELKKPSTVLEPEDWKGHNARQWRYLRDLDNLLLTNGREIRWFRLGELQDAPASLPSPDGDEEWDAQPLLRILQLFSEGRVTPITSVARLARRVAPLARALRDRIELQLGDPTAVGHPALTRAFEVWRARLQDDADSRQFSDAVAQVIAYSLVIAALDGNADANNDRTITLAEARDVLRGPNRVLAAALGPVIEVTGLLESIRLEVGAIEQLVSGVDAEKIRTRKDPRGEPWLWFYEDFLAIYDPDERKDAGVYYTPIEVVECITRLIDETLAERFGRRLGFTDANITTLDPACGTGTFPLAVIDRGVARAVDERGPAGEAQAATSLARNLYGFELLAGPYSVAHLRIAQRLRQLGAELPENGVNVLLADTLASPNDDSGAAQPLWGDDKVLADPFSRRPFRGSLGSVCGAHYHASMRRLESASGDGSYLAEGDCLELLVDVPDGSVDMVLCDLPYGVTQNHWDSEIPLDQLWREYRRVVKPNGAIVLFSQGMFTARLMLSNEQMFKYKFVWEKSKPTNFLNARRQPLRKHEEVCVFYGRQPTYNPQMSPGRPYDKGVRKAQKTGSYGDFDPVRVNSEGGRFPTDVVYFKTAESEGEVWHPTQKPVGFLRWLIRTYTDPGEIVLDNASGSGTTLVAAVEERRRFIGMELNSDSVRFKERAIDLVEVTRARLESAGFMLVAPTSSTVEAPVIAASA